MTRRRYGCIAIVPAGGSGARFGAALPKQYVEILGKPVLEHTLAALRTDARIEQCFVVVPPGEKRADAIAAAAGATVLYCSGATRAATVHAALAATASQVTADAWALVHDAARPCLPRSALAALLDALGEHPVGGLLALPVADTLKRVDRTHAVIETLPREGVWRAQTPQMFRHATLMHALAAAPDVTDEAQAIEALGLAPRVVPGSAANLKITHADDAALAAYHLAHHDHVEHSR